MIGIKVTIPIACFRKGMARSYLETDQIPPPSTCYGFLLSLVGETERERHIGVRVTPVLLSQPDQSVILRTIWRIKDKNEPVGTKNNKTMDYQQLLTDIRLILWLDSSEEENRDVPTLEERVQNALDPNHRGVIERFGGLSLGESTHLVDEVSLYDPDLTELTDEERTGAKMIQCVPDGLQTWTVWVDHVGAEKTRYVTGSLVQGGIFPPEPALMPQIHS